MSHLDGKKEGKEDVQGERENTFRKAWRPGICLAGLRSSWGGRGLVEEDPCRRAETGVKPSCFPAQHQGQGTINSTISKG